MPRPATIVRSIVKVRVLANKETILSASHATWREECALWSLGAWLTLECERELVSKGSLARCGRPSDTHNLETASSAVLVVDLLGTLPDLGLQASLTRVDEDPTYGVSVWHRADIRRTSNARPLGRKHLLARGKSAFFLDNSSWAASGMLFDSRQPAWKLRREISPPA